MEFESSEKLAMIYETLKKAVAYFKEELFAKTKSLHHC